MKNSVKKSYKILVLISIFFFLTLAAIIFNSYYHYTNIKHIQLDSDKTTANILQSLLSEHQTAALALLQSYANRPLLITDVKEKNEKNILFHLEQLENKNEEIDWLFVTDTKGVLWANYPVAKVAHGKDLSHRDWYKGVRKEWKPYISSIFKLIVGDKELGVALSVPVFDQKGQIIGILSNAHRTFFLRRIIEQVNFDQYAKVTLIDQAGQIVYSNKYPLAKEVVKYPFLSQMKKAILEQKNAYEIDDPEQGNEKNYATIASLKDFGWTIIIERTGKDIFLSSLSYYIQTIIITILLFLVIVISFFYISRKQDQVALQRANDELEQRVAERTEKLEKVNEELHKDITERKRAENLLLISEARLSEAQRIAQIGNWELDLISNTLFWSDEIYRIFGLNPQQFDASYEGFLENIHPDDQAIVDKAYTDSLKNKTPYKIVHRLLLRDGTIKFVNEHCETFYDESGKAIRSFGTIQDITERKQVEDSLHKTQVFNKTLLDTSPDLIYVYDIIDRKNIYSNHGIMKILGYSVQEIQEMGETILSDLMHPDDFNRYLKDIIPCYQTARDGEIIEHEYRMKHKGGTWAWLHSKELIFNRLGDGLPRQIFGLTSDVTERKQSAEKLKRAYDEMEIKVEQRTKDLSQANIRLQELDRLKSMFIASMSHELRTPLNSIIGFTGILLQGISGKIDAEAVEDLNIVYNSSKHLLSLINDVIDISKIEADKLDIHFEEVKIKDVIEEIVSIVSKDAEKKNLKIKTEFPDGLTIISDKRRLFQCILNLMSNAIKFTEKGVVKLKVEQTAGLLMIIVTDTGIGIKKEDLSKLFKSFVRLETPLKEETAGTGLGLYLTQKIMTNVFQGGISFESEYGKGSAFTLEIPLKQNIEP